MHKDIIRILKSLKRRYTTKNPPVAKFGATYEGAVISGQAASDLVKEKLLEDKPALICRFGSVELNCVLNYYFIKLNRSLIVKSLEYVKGETPPFWWEEENISMMCNNAGFFPPSIELLEKFSELMLEDMKNIDILGSWMKEERFIDHYISNAVKVRLPDLEPYYHQHPWTSALKGKTVLVIHPYAESIEKQYSIREKLFENQEVLPEFKLKTIKAVQSIANSATGYKDWFEAFEDMCSQISKTDFDVAIIGCGAYGLPLAAFVKKIGKKAVHLGGSTQILFGIKGKRWEEHEVISKLMNEHWVRPMKSECPENFAKVEDGCYW